MPATSKAQFRFFKALENNPQLRKKHGISKRKAAEYTSDNGNYSDLPDRKHKIKALKKLRGE